MEPPIHASIPVSKLGYEWRERLVKAGAGKAARVPMLRPKTSPENPESYRHYDPFRDEPALFQIFADLEPSREAIIGFADQYGIIEDESELGIRQWSNSIREIRWAISVWNAIQARDEEIIRRLVSQSTTGESNMPEVEQPVILLTNKSIRRSGEESSCSPLIESAFDLLTGKIREEIAKSWLHPVHSQCGGLAIRIAVSSLKTALWLQFALALSENKEYRRCELCGRPFELSPKVNRADRVFCTDNCRVKSYQRRQAKARRLRAEGATLAHIAKKFGTDTRSVKRWLGEAK